MSVDSVPWGIGLRILDGDTQAAIDLASALFRQGYGRPPTHVALPPDCDMATVNIYTLTRAHDCGPGNVIVGEACEQGEGEK